MNYRIGIDTGGTFTDAASIDDQGNIVLGKAATTPSNLTDGVMNAIGELAKLNGLGRQEFLEKVKIIVHGTTQATNTIITRTGPKLGLIATEGHRDVIQLRRVPRSNMWDWNKHFPEVLVPRYLRVGITERVNARGEVYTPLDEKSVLEAIAYFKKLNVKDVVVCLIFSFMNSVHEKKVAEIFAKEYPEANVTLSSDILPAIGEYERTSTAIISAYVSRAIQDYSKKLTALLEAEGFKGQFLYIQNNGGVETAEIAMQKPATVAMSGPAGGPSAAISIGNLHGIKDLLAIDMGGTSFEIAPIVKGNFLTKTESLLDQHRFSLPVIDLNSIGAGGGSIAHLDVAGVLRVGPQSAGASPGPACYGKGGELPTVTDANVILGYLNPDFFLGGDMKLRKDLAEKAIREHIADPLGISVEQAALAIYKISNAVMADAVSAMYTTRGYDPRDFVLCAGGAASPVCALAIAKELRMKQVLIPKYAPVFCAVGMLGVDLKHDFNRFYHAQYSELDIDQVKALYKEMEEEGMALLEKEGVPENLRRVERTMQVQYFGQFRGVEVAWPSGPITAETIAEGVKAFHEKHRLVYGSSNENYPLVFTGFGLSVIGGMPRTEISKIDRDGTAPQKAFKCERDVYFSEEAGSQKANVYDGAAVLAGMELEGPCIVEDRMTSIVVPPGEKLIVDDYGNFITA